MKNYFNYILLLFITLFATSCDLTSDPSVGETNTAKFAGEWYLQLMDATDSTVYINYSLATTSNTASNVGDKIWFNDGEHFWNFQCIVNVNQDNLTFNVDSSINIFYEDPKTPASKPVVDIGTLKIVQSGAPERMKIENGKISKGTFTPPSKTNTDFMSCLMTGIYKDFSFVAESYDIKDIDPDTAVVKLDTNVIWKFVNKKDNFDGPYIISGYKRTGFLEDEH
ncbi:MAG TPA: lipid-binding protein [Saprospiraceae bacterium]|nr:lipid-binding protein [Saprospiraceae bacterium]